MFVFAHHGTYLDSLLISFAGKFLVRMCTTCVARLLKVM